MDPRALHGPPGSSDTSVRTVALDDKSRSFSNPSLDLSGFSPGHRLNRHYYFATL